MTTPLPVLLRAARQLGSVFFDRSHTPDAVIEEIIEYATQARKQGIVSLEQQAAAVQDPFCARRSTWRWMHRHEPDPQHHGARITLMEQDGEMEARSSIAPEAIRRHWNYRRRAGPDPGHEEPRQHHEVGGHCVGVLWLQSTCGLANLLFSPRQQAESRVRDAVRIREVMLEGVLSIVEGLNPKLIRSKLEAYQQQQPAPARRASQGTPALPADRFPRKVMWRARNDSGA